MLGCRCPWDPKEEGPSLLPLGIYCIVGKPLRRTPPAEADPLPVGGTVPWCLERCPHVGLGGSRDLQLCFMCEECQPGGQSH